jgi:hypothetical protein
MFVLSLVFSLLRAPLVILGVNAWSNLENLPDDPVLSTIPIEVMSGASIVLLGVAANLGLLFKQRWGVWLGVMTVAASLVSVALALWQLSIVVQNNPDGPERMGVLIGALMAMAIRLTIIGLYLAAVLKMSKWLARQRTLSA